MANIFRRPSVTDYPFERPKLMRAYANNMKAFLKHRHPDIDDTVIENFVIDYVKKNLKRPRVMAQTHPRYGVTEKKVFDLLDYIGNLGDDVITPAGVTYMPATKKKSMLSDVLRESVAARNKFKHKQLEAAAVGDLVQEQISKLLQASAKIFNNSIPGAMGTIYSFLFDLPGYNAITSTGRQCVKTGYAHTERMLGSNLYLPSLDDTINYVVNHLKVFPHNRVRAVMEKYKLNYPTTEMVTNWLLGCMKFYCDTDPIAERLSSYIASLTDDQRAFVFYTYGYRNLLLENEEVMRGYLTEFFRRDLGFDPKADPKEIYKIEDDLLAMASSLNFDLIDREPKLNEAIDNNPDGVRKLLAICQHMEKTLQSWEDLWTTFFMVDVDVARLWEHPDIVRRCVLVSDTDSVIFSTDMVVEWYTPNRFSQDGADINALSVFMVSQSLEHLFARMSASMGMIGDDRKLIKMKNEFYYPIFIRSPMAKHYIGPVHIQEGKILPKPKMDVKGLNYRGSDIPSETGTAFKTFTDWVTNEITEKETLSIQETIGRVATHEQRIYRSLMSGEKTFLGSRPIRRPEEYTDPIASDYFYWLLWDRVFAPSFGSFELPNKGYVLPLLGNGKILDLEEWTNLLKAFDPELEARFTAFKEEHPKKAITRIIIPPSLSEVPKIFRTILDVRKIIHANGRPFFLLLKSLGYPIDDKAGRYIASDFIQLDNPIDVAIT